MIERLRISSLALVDELEIEFGAGLNVLTGETGAGKSIVLSALALLAGARPKPGSVREGAENAAVEAVFRTEQLPALRAALAARGLADEHGELIVRRTLTADGRSRAWVAGASAGLKRAARMRSRTGWSSRGCCSPRNSRRATPGTRRIPLPWRRKVSARTCACPWSRASRAT